MGHLGAIEGGGTWFRVATGTAAGRILHTERLPTTDPGSTLAAVVRFFTDHPVSALGVGCFGPLSLHPGAPDFGRIRATPKPGWTGVDLLGILRTRLGVPVVLQTDVLAAAIGEHAAGAGAGAGSLVYLTVGTGVGGGFLVGGQPVPGRHHPEMGHLPLPQPPDFAGVCPFHGGCLEGLVSGPALAARWGMPGEALSADHPAWAHTAAHLADGLTALMAVLAPDRVILGGGVGSNPALWPPLLAALRVRLADYWPAVHPETWLVPPGLGEHSALTGGLVMAQRASGL